jgi:hypothetical protein
MNESQPPVGDDFVEFFRAGDPVAGEYQCVACARPAVHRGLLSRCAGCGSALWERGSRAPFADVFDGLGRRLALLSGAETPRSETRHTPASVTSPSARDRSSARDR